MDFTSRKRLLFLRFLREVPKKAVQRYTLLLKNGNILFAKMRWKPIFMR